MENVYIEMCIKFYLKDKMLTNLLIKSENHELCLHTLSVWTALVPVTFDASCFAAVRMPSSPLFPDSPHAVF